MTNKFKYIIAAALAFIVATPASAQVCTYTEQNGATKNCIKVELGAGPTGASAQQTQGAGANGAAVTGNPNLIAGSDGTLARTVKVDTAGRVIVDTGSHAADADGLANIAMYLQSSGTSSAYPLSVFPSLYNGTTWDMQRGLNGAMYTYLDKVVDATTDITSVSSATVGWSGSTAGYAGITFQQIIGSSNTIIIEGSNDGGTTWSGISFRQANPIITNTVQGNVGTSTANGAVMIPVLTMPMMRWRVATYVSGTITIATGFKREATMQSSYTVSRALLTDGSGSVTTGGTSQQVFAASTFRSFLRCSNPSVAASGVAAESLFINYTTAASTTVGSSEEIANGGSVTFENAFAPQDAINITAATTGHKFTCKQA